MHTQRGLVADSTHAACTHHEHVFTKHSTPMPSSKYNHKNLHPHHPLKLPEIPVSRKRYVTNNSTEGLETKNITPTHSLHIHPTYSSFVSCSHLPLSLTGTLWQAFKMALAVPSFDTLLHKRYPPPPHLVNEISSVGRALAPHRLAPCWVHP